MINVNKIMVPSGKYLECLKNPAPVPAGITFVPVPAGIFFILAGINALPARSRSTPALAGRNLNDFCGGTVEQTQ